MKGCRPLTDDEIHKVLASFTGRYAQRNRAMFMLGVKTGFRISEILSLRVRDVLQGDEVVEQITVYRRNMKGKVESRRVPLHPEAREELARWLEQQGGAPESYVFRSREGWNHPLTVERTWQILKEAYRKSEIEGPVATHSMRKTFANKVYQSLLRRQVAGEAVDAFRLTSKALCHKNINSTDGFIDIFLQKR